MARTSGSKREADGFGKSSSVITNVPLCIRDLDADIQTVLRGVFARNNGNTTANDIVDLINRSPTLPRHILAESRRHNTVFIRTMKGSGIYEAAEFVQAIKQLPAG